MSAADKVRKLAETIVLGNDERMKQELLAKVERNRQEDAKRQEGQ